MPEATWFKLRSHWDVVQHGVIQFLGFSGRDIAEGLEQAPVVKSVHPFQCGIFHGFKGPPWSSSMYHLGLIKALGRLSQSIVIAVADAANRWLDPGFGKPLRV